MFPTQTDGPHKVGPVGPRRGRRHTAPHQSSFGALDMEKGGRRAMHRTPTSSISGGTYCRPLPETFRMAIHDGR